MIAAEPFMLFFRFLHIVAGVLWVGSAFLFVGFIGPSAAEVGPSSGPLLSAAVKKRKVVKVIVGLGFTTVIAGWVMWLRYLIEADSLGDWVGSSFGLVLTIGGILVTIAAFVGTFGVGRNVERLVDLGGEIAASGGAALSGATGEAGSPLGGTREAREDRPDPSAPYGGRDGDGSLLVATVGRQPTGQALDRISSDGMRPGGCGDEESDGRGWGQRSRVRRGGDPTEWGRRSDVAHSTDPSDPM